MIVVETVKFVITAFRVRKDAGVQIGVETHFTALLKTQKVRRSDVWREEVKDTTACVGGDSKRPVHWKTTSERLGEHFKLTQRAAMSRLNTSSIERSYTARTDSKPFSARDDTGTILEKIGGNPPRIPHSTYNHVTRNHFEWGHSQDARVVDVCKAQTSGKPQKVYLWNKKRLSYTRHESDKFTRGKQCRWCARATNLEG